MTLAQVIDRALEEGLSISFAGSVTEHIAAAVTVHLLGDEAVERAAKAARPDAWAEDGEIGKIISAHAKANYYAGLRKVLLTRTRAAIRAALGALS